MQLLPETKAQVQGLECTSAQKLCPMLPLAGSSPILDSQSLNPSSQVKNYA